MINSAGLKGQASYLRLCAAPHWSCGLCGQTLYMSAIPVDCDHHHCCYCSLARLYTVGVQLQAAAKIYRQAAAFRGLVSFGLVTGILGV